MVVTVQYGIYYILYLALTSFSTPDLLHDDILADTSALATSPRLSGVGVDDWIGFRVLTGFF